MPKLSILIPSLSNRTEFLTRLLGILNPQITKEVEVLICIDNYAKTTGKKRNELIEQARGKYIVFIDDDDLISENYVSKILEAIEQNADFISIGILYAPIKGDHCPVVCDLSYTWEFKDGVHRRNALGTSPIKREFALQVKYPDVSGVEDKPWSDEVTLLLKTQYRIDDILYFHQYRDK